MTKATYQFPIMKALLEQLKGRRLALGLKQKDRMLRIGVSRQQYQHLESKGNPRLNTLELIAEGLKSELLCSRQKVRGYIPSYPTYSQKEHYGN